MQGSCVDINGRALLQLLGPTIQVWDYDSWVRNYIQVEHDVFNGLPYTEDRPSSHMATFYIREPGERLTQVVLKDRRRVDRISMPDDTRYVWWDRAVPTIEGGNFSYPTVASRLDFYYSPSLGYRVPPPEVIDAPLTAEITRLYPDYYHGGGPGYKKARETKCSHGYNLTDSCPGCDADFEGREDIV